ncbi:hypothetical protein TorRG33x02_035960 [Trema orientale]|uniref:Uncharacterized protein n=1 Tax=Trema orientale TaxID=63057 RepID=A0A2P5FRY0_TREOI|nr:hypothetical protein TorRG33x02_035960 [Trema orientale]
MSSTIRIPSKEELETYEVELHTIRQAIADCEFHIELFTGGIDVDRSRVEVSLEEGKLGIPMEHRRRQETREQLVRSYQRQKKYEEEKLQKIKEIWFDKFGALSGWRRWEE